MSDDRAISIQVQLNLDLSIGTELGKILTFLDSARSRGMRMACFLAVCLVISTLIIMSLLPSPPIPLTVILLAQRQGSLSLLEIDFFSKYLLLLGCEV